MEEPIDVQILCFRASYSSPLVVMMEPADVGKGNYPPYFISQPHVIS